ncbi:MAG: SH3 domain-containing protein [Anaerolineae bacterium]
MKITALLLMLALALIVSAQSATPQVDPQSMLALERAVLLNPRDPERALQWQQLTSDTPLTFSLGNLSDWLASFLTLQEHSAMTFVLWWAFNGLLILGVMAPRLRAWAAPARVLALLLLVVVGGAFALRLVVDTTQPRAVVIADTAARVGPEQTFLVVHQFTAPTRVRVTSREQAWVLVSGVDGRTGWIPAATIEYVIPPD